MLDIAWYAAKLLFKGKLVRDPVHFVRQTAIGVIICSLILMSLAQAEFPLGMSIIVSSSATGMIMPFLLKDLKMK